MVFVTFLPVIENGFVTFDDPDYVTTNGHVQQGLSWANMRWAVSSTQAANWHPLTWLSHMLDYQLFGLKPWGHHFTSLLLHALNVVLAFLALERLTGATWRSFVVALIFGLHPLRVESVAWVAERKDVLGAAFWLLTLWAYALYAEAKVVRQSPEAKDSGRRTRLYYVLSLTCFYLGLMAKPMLVTLPCVLLLLDFWPLGRLHVGTVKSVLPKLLLEKLPFFLGTVAVSLVTFLAQKQGGAIAMNVPLRARAENIPVAYCRYLGKLIWPADLAVFYPQVHWQVGLVLGACAILLAITIWTIRLRVRYPFVVVGWFWFIGTLVPVIGLIPVGAQSMADRYTYLPSLGVLVLVVWGAYDLTRDRRPVVTVGIGMAVVAVVGCVAVTRRQISFWKDSEALFEHAVQATRENYLAHNNLGTTYNQQGRFKEAVAEFQQALVEKPDCAEAHNNWGLVLSTQGLPDAAISHYLEALKLNRDYVAAHVNLGVALGDQGRSEDALTHYRAALGLQPDCADAHCNLGIEYARQGRLDEAMRELQTTLALQPNDAGAHYNFGMVLESKGAFEAAASQYVRTLELDPGHERAHFHLGTILSRQGKLDAAISEFQQALKLKPDYAAAQSNLASVLEFKRGRNGR